MSKINNWFIHSEYKEENGIYVQCKDYNTYQNLFELNQIYYNKNKFLGYCNDEMDIFLIHNENYNSDGDENGCFKKELIILSYLVNLPLMSPGRYPEFDK